MVIPHMSVNAETISSFVFLSAVLFTLWPRGSKEGVYVLFRTWAWVAVWVFFTPRWPVLIDVIVMMMSAAVLELIYEVAVVFTSPVSDSDSD